MISEIPSERRPLILDDLLRAKQLMDKMEIPKGGRMMMGYLAIKSVLEAKRFPRKIKKGLKQGSILLNFSDRYNRLERIKKPH